MKSSRVEHFQVTCIAEYESIMNILPRFYHVFHIPTRDISPPPPFRILASNWVYSIVLELCSIALQLFSIVLTSSPRYGVGGWGTLASIAIFNAKPPGINCASIVLNCADIISSCAGLHLEIRGGGFWSSVPPPLRISG